MSKNLYHKSHKCNRQYFIQNIFENAFSIKSKNFTVLIFRTLALELYFKCKYLVIEKPNILNKLFKFNKKYYRAQAMDLKTLKN